MMNSIQGFSIWQIGRGFTYMRTTYMYKSCSIIVYLSDEPLLIKISSFCDDDSVARYKLIGGFN